MHLEKTKTAPPKTTPKIVPDPTRTPFVQPKVDPRPKS